ncbi:MAG: YdeI/OmpD-associated family protein [Planctomycetota bacterium]
MVTRDPRIDSYIEAAPSFARPILLELRARLHAACPDVVETMKWSSPAFEHHGILAVMSAFKAHCAFVLWKGKILEADAEIAAVLAPCAKLRSEDDLPMRPAFSKAVKAAMALNQEKAATPRSARAATKAGTAKKAKKPPIAAHPQFARALAANKAATAVFAAFPPSAQRDYLEWIATAKQEETRMRRIEQAVEWIAEGKRRHWKYESC